MLISYDHRLIDESAKKIVEAAKRLVLVSTYSPSNRKRSLHSNVHHTNTKIVEQSERRTHKRLIDIVETTPKTMDALIHLEIPAGVDIVLK